MNKLLLVEELEKRSAVRNDWLSGLEGRKLAELEFHNKHRDKSRLDTLDRDTYEKLYGNKKFYRTVKLSSDYLDEWIRQHSVGRIFLDYACGDGSNAVKAAKAGAELAVGLDISDVSVRNAKARAEAEGVSSNTYFVQGDCEITGLPSNSIDAAVCSGMLHHLDLSYAFYELRRILKPGGVVIAFESLNYNPLIKLYRALTPQMRTEWEKAHILSLRDLTFAARFFEVRDVRCWHLFSIAGAFYPAALPLLNMIDKVVLKIPLIRLMAWIFTFELHKSG